MLKLSDPLTVGSMTFGAVHWARRFVYMVHFVFSMCSYV
jgi:hypothetical protein